MNPNQPNQPQFTESHALEFDPAGLHPPTAWQSIPSPVRFAAWVWAISVIVSVIGALIIAALMIFGVAAGLGSMS